MRSPRTEQRGYAHVLRQAIGAIAFGTFTFQGVVAQETDETPKAEPETTDETPTTPPSRTPPAGEAAKKAGAKPAAPPKAATKPNGTNGAKKNGAAAAQPNGKAGAKTNGKAQAPPAGAGAKGAPPARAGQQDPGGIGAPPGPGAKDGPGGNQVVIEPQSPVGGGRIDISAGDIEVLEFLKFLATYTQLPLIVDTRNQQALKTTITIAADMVNVDAEIVIAILRTNGFLVTRFTVGSPPSEREVLQVEPQQAAVPTPDEPSENKLISVADGRAEYIDSKVTAELQGIRPDEIATMVFTLKHTQPADAITSLNNLISGQKAVKSKAFSIVDVKNSMLVIITAKFGLLNYLQKLLTIIDVPIKEPERIIQIVSVENADADELTNLILQFLQGRTGTGGRGLGGRSQPAVAQPGQPGQPNIPGASARQDLQTNLIPDWRTQKIIVETYSERDLEDINMLLRELDTRYDIRRLRTRIYQVRYLKADEVAADLQSLLGGQSFGLSGRAGLGTRAGAAGAGRTSRTRGAVPRVGGRQQPGLTTPTPGGAPGAQQGGQSAPQPALIVPHIQTNSLIIQAEPEDYAEILSILEQIDIKRRQVFLEAALVEVTSQSQLNFAIELLAGDPSDEAARVLFESSFGLTGLDFENFNRAIPDLTNPAAVPPGALVAVMNRGKFPAIVRFFKGNTDSQVLATPFILADDNQTNTIDIIETRFVQNTATGPSNITTASNEGEDAGISLEITPTISSQSAVFLELALEVSQFQGAGTPQVLPPKTRNSISSAVTIPDGEIFVIGGLTRENKSKSVSKVPIVGDIPLIGKLFRSEDSFKSASNLYIFLRAHVLTHPEFIDGIDLTHKAMGFVHEFAPGLEPVRFPRPNVPPPAVPPRDPDAPQRIYSGPRRSDYSDGVEAPQGPYEVQDPERGRSGSRPESYRDDPESPFRGAEGTAPIPRSAGDEPGGLQNPREGGGSGDTISEEEAKPAPNLAEQRRRGLLGTGVELDPDGESWIIPIRRTKS